jgi:hypothetical protein
MKRAHMIVAASAILVGLTRSSASADTIKPKAPTAKEAIRILLDNAKMPLKKIESCKSMIVGQDGTLGGYFSTMLSFQSESGASGTFEVTSKQLRATGKVVWQTDVFAAGPRHRNRSVEQRLSVQPRRPFPDADSIYAQLHRHRLNRHRLNPHRTITNPT